MSGEIGSTVAAVPSNPGAHVEPSYREIEIVGSILPRALEHGRFHAIGNGNAHVRGEDVIVASDIIRQIDDAEAAGARALLLVIESEGGELGAGMRIVHRLRRFSETGGRVVAFVQGKCSSTAPLIVAAADLVLMAAKGKLRLHGAHAPPGVDVERANDLVAGYLAPRLGMPLERLRVLCSDPEIVAEAHDRGAVRLGWADFYAATLEHARSFAKLLAHGCEIPDTPRTRRLAGALALSLACAVGCGREVPADIVGHQTSSSDGPIDPESPGFVERKVLETILRNWTIRSAQTGFKAVAANTSGLVAVGISKCYTSKDAADWTSRTIPAGTYNGVAFEASSALFAAVGNAAKAATSANNGETWTARTIPGGADDYYNGIAVHGTRLVAVGEKTASPYGGIAATSDDGGVTWTARTIPGNDGLGYAAVASDGSMLVAVGIGGTCAYSLDDGETWAAHNGDSGSGFLGIASGQGLWVAVGDAAGNVGHVATWTGNTADAWVVRTLPDGTAPLKPIISASGLIFLAAESDPDVAVSHLLTSGNGADWRMVGMTVPKQGYSGLVWTGDVACGVGAGIGTSLVAAR